MGDVTWIMSVFFTITVRIARCGPGNFDTKRKAEVTNRDAPNRNDFISRSVLLPRDV